MAGPYHDRYNPYTPDYNSVEHDEEDSFPKNSMSNSFGSATKSKLGKKYFQLTFPSNLNSADFELGHVVQFGFLVDPRVAGDSVMRKVFTLSSTGSPNEAFANSLTRKANLTGNINKVAKAALGKETKLVKNYGGNKQTHDTIAMYMPSLPQANYAHTYNTAVTSALGASLASAADDATDAGVAVINALASIPQRGSFNLKDGKFFNELSKAAAAAKKAGGKMSPEALLTQTLNAPGIGVVSATLRQVVNPRLEMLYQSTAPRTFAYTFKMNPSSEDESETIQQIIHKFKVASHPSIKQNTGKHVLRYPAEILIKHMSYGKENKYINRIHDCVCTGVTVDYNTEGSFQAHRPTGKGAPPATVTLTLNFQETEMMTADMIHGGGY